MPICPRFFNQPSNKWGSRRWHGLFRPFDIYIYIYCNVHTYVHMHCLPTELCSQYDGGGKMCKLRHNASLALFRTYLMPIFFSRPQAMPFPSEVVDSEEWKVSCSIDQGASLGSLYEPFFICCIHSCAANHGVVGLASPRWWTQLYAQSETCGGYDAFSLFVMGINTTTEVNEECSGNSVEPYEEVRLLLL